MIRAKGAPMIRFTFKSLIIISSFLIAGFTAGGSDSSSLRYTAMGGAGIALYDSPHAFKINPASLFVQEPALFSVDMTGSESIVPSSLGEDDPLWSMQNPSTLLEFVFSTRYSALCVGFGFDLTDREVNSTGDGLIFDAYNNSHIQFNVAYGFGSFSFGMYARGGSQMQRLGIEIDASTALVDYISQVYLNRYYPSNEDQQFSSGIGILVAYPYISLAVLTDSFFVVDYDTNEVSIDIVDLLEDTSVGLAFSTNAYDEDNNLNPVVFTSVFDICDIADETYRSIRFGLEVKFQFLKDLNIALQTGYRETRATPLSLIGIEGDGDASVGISSQINNLFFNSVFVLPLSWLSSGESTDSAAIELSLHYNL